MIPLTPQGSAWPGGSRLLHHAVPPGRLARAPSAEFLADRLHATRRALQTGKLHAVRDYWSKWAPNAVWPLTEKDAWAAVYQAAIRMPELTAAEQAQALAWLDAHKHGYPVGKRARAAVLARVAAEVAAELDELEAVTAKLAA